MQISLQTDLHAFPWEKKINGENLIKTVQTFFPLVII